MLDNRRRSRAPQYSRQKGSTENQSLREGVPLTLRLRQYFVDLLIGPPLASEEQPERQIGPVTGLPIFGLDGLSSAAYGPEAALAVLGAAGAAYVEPITWIILLLLAILYISYRQTIRAYPKAGGSYI